MCLRHWRILAQPFHFPFKAIVDGLRGEISSTQRVKINCWKKFVIPSKTKTFFGNIMLDIM